MPIKGRGRFRKEAGAHEDEGNAQIRRYVALKRPHVERALDMLKDVGRAVAPLMLEREWTLPVLAEFYPRSERLLGVNINQGQKICLRLRSGTDPNNFLPRSEVIGTMLHELAHNVRGPHDTRFYSVLEELTARYDSAMRLGYWPGAGFLSPGQRLGGGRAPATLFERRNAAVAAAASRASGSHGGAYRLGGTNPTQRSLRELAAEAALRRIADSKTCASALAEAEQLADVAGDDDVVVVSDDSDDDSSSHNGLHSPPTHPHRPAAGLRGTPDDPIVLDDSD
ncbi:hypothetical protein MCUN1_001200 [Malassezia cuniculi]|uniref:WLM domain-containing protein n=1 Tax=Malassezia cuniculi TaxID=948313 RepID=A0AAF0EU03_9BASI|nr:hypothetical protein MCUN1_001200 [Malassezia cuniculi]